MANSEMEGKQSLPGSAYRLWSEPLLNADPGRKYIGAMSRRNGAGVRLGLFTTTAIIFRFM